MFLLYCGTSLNGGVAFERRRYSNGILIPDFFLTYLLATKVDSWFLLMQKSDIQINKVFDKKFWVYENNPFLYSVVKLSFFIKQG